jgi:hypothetical protein
MYNLFERVGALVELKQHFSMYIKTKGWCFWVFIVFFNIVLFLYFTKKIMIMIKKIIATYFYETVKHEIYFY